MAFIRFIRTSFLLLFLPLAPAGSTVPHPLYVSITEMNYNPTAHTVEISCKIFTDDLEKALADKSPKPPHITENPNPEIAAEIGAYISRNLVINFDGKKVPVRFLGYEVEKEAVWSYLEGPVATEPKTADLTNSILYDAFDQQINLIHVTVNGKRRSTKLVNPETQVKLAF